MSWFDSSSFRDSSEHVWWHADKFDITASIDVSFQRPEIVLTEPSVASIVAEAESFDIEITATNVGIISHMSVAFLEPHLEFSPGHFVSCTFEPLNFESVSFIKGEDMDNCVFKELTMFAIGDSRFNSITATAKNFDCQMRNGVSVQLSMQRPTCSGVAIAGVTGDMDSSLQPFEFAGVGGPPPYVDCVFVEPEAILEGSTPHLARMTATSRMLGCVFEGRSEIIASLLATMRPIYTGGWGGTVSLVSSISCSFSPMYLAITDISHLSGYMSVDFDRLDMGARMLVDGQNEIDVRLGELGGEFTIGGESETACGADQATLEFGVV